jgi:hypothetical protein
VISGDRTHEKRVYWNPTAVKLEEADRLLGHGKTVEEVCKDFFSPGEAVTQRLTLYVHVNPWFINSKPMAISKPADLFNSGLRQKQAASTPSVN